MNETTLYIASALLAFLPAAIWLSILFKRTKQKAIQLLIFFGSIFSVVPVFILQYFFNNFPQFDVVNFLQTKIHNQEINFLILFISVGIVEEIVKQSILRSVDRKYLLIQTIGESVQFSLVAALGFSFAENIFYIFNIWQNLGLQELFVSYFFRSIFTTCAHMIFSGFFGYYYGLAKFSLKIREQSRWIGKKMYFTNFIAKILQLPKSEALKEVMILKGLFIAMILHAFFDLLLELNHVVPVVVFVIFGYSILRLLLKQKSGRLILITDVENERASTMAKNDEDVVIELMAMWFQQQKYVDVIHICERLLERDPDNKVVQLFKAQAIDKIDKKNVYYNVLQKIFPKKESQPSLAELAKSQKT